MKSLLRVTTLLVALTGAKLLGAATHTGTVISVEGDIAKVAMNSNVMPAVGARGEFFFKIEGTDAEVSVATGSALKIDHGDLLVKIESTTGTVEKGQLVRFGPAEGATTASRSPAVTPPPPLPSPTRTLPPSVPFPSVTPKPATPPARLPQSPKPSPKEEPGRTIAQRSEVEMMASTVVTFDELTPGPLAGDAFAKHGLRLVPARGVPGVYKAEPNMILPSPCTNVMLLGGERVTSFTIILDPPVKRLALYRIGAAKGASVPTWKMTAYNAKGKVVGSKGEQHNLPSRAMYFSVDAENITRAEITTDNRYGTGTWATWNSLPIAGFGFDR
jgi:hypothetical protein